jgi:hypothetical protein
MSSRSSIYLPFAGVARCIVDATTRRRKVAVGSRFDKKKRRLTSHSA